MIFKTSTVQT